MIIHLTEEELRARLPDLWKENGEQVSFMVTNQVGKPHHIVTVSPYENRRSFDVLFSPLGKGFSIKGDINYPTEEEWKEI